MNRNILRILSAIGLLFIVISLFTSYLGINKILLLAGTRQSLFRAMLMVTGIILFSMYYGKIIIDYLSQRLKRIIPGFSDLFAAAIILIGALSFIYRDVVFEGKTFLMLNGTAATLPGENVYGYDNPRPQFYPVSDPGAIAWQIEPFNRFFSIELKNGEFPLWNPHAGLAGRPLFVDGHTALFEPIQLLFAFLPDQWWPWAVDFQLLLRYFLAGLFTYLFLRKINIGFWGSVGGGIAFMLSSYFLRWGGHPQVKTETLLPFVLYGYERLIADKDWKSRIISAIAIGWCILAAMPESTFFALFLGTLWYFYRSILIIIGDGNKKKYIKNAILNYLIATFIGFSLAAINLVPFIEFIGSAFHTHLQGSGFNGYPFWVAITTFIPYLWKETVFFETDHFRIIVLVFAFAALIPIKKNRSHLLYGIFFAIYALIFFCTIFNVPIFQWIGNLPFLNQINMIKYPFLSIDFSLAVLFGIGLDSFVEKSLTPRQMMISFHIIFSLLLSSVLIYFVSGLTPPDKMRFLRQFLIAVTPLCVLGFILGINYIKGIPSLTSKIGVILILLMETAIWKDYVVRPIRYDPYTQPPFVTFLKEQSAPSRIMVYGNGALYPNISTAYELDDVRFLDAIIPYRTHYFFNNLIAQETEPTRFTGNENPVYKKMLDLLNVKYFITTHPLNSNFQIIDLFPKSYLGLQELHGQTINALTISPFTSIKAQLLLPPSGSVLNFDLALLSDSGITDAIEKGYFFQINLSIEGQANIIFKRDISELINANRKDWENIQVDLTPWRGKIASFEFSIETKQANNKQGGIEIALSNPYIEIQEDLVNFWREDQINVNSDEVHLTNEIYNQNLFLVSNQFDIRYLNLSGVKHETIFEHPPAGPVNLTLKLPDLTSQLLFSIGIDSAVYDADTHGDGVGFHVRLTDKTGQNFDLFNKYINPESNFAERKWMDQTIDLTPWKGEDVILSFETDPGPKGDNSNDWAHWGDIRLKSPNIFTDQYWKYYNVTTDLNLVYNNEVLIYENKSAYPRAFVVFNTIQVNSFNEALNALSDPGINLSTTAIVEDPKNTITLQSANLPTEAQIISRSANSIDIKASIDADGLLVLSEAYDSGWQAYLDGKSVRIYVVDGILRGIYLDKGTHTIKFVYRPISLIIGGIITVLALLTIIIYAICSYLNHSLRTSLRKKGSIADKNP